MHAAAAADVAQRLQQRLLRHARLLQQAGRGGGDVEHRQQQVLGGHEAVAELLGARPRGVEEPVALRRHVDLAGIGAAAGDLRAAAKLALDPADERGDLHAALLEHPAGHALLLLEHREQDVLDVKLVMRVSAQDLLALRDRFLRLVRELLEIHHVTCL